MNNIYFWISPRVFVKIQNGPHGILRDPMKNIRSWISLRIFEKYMKWFLGDTQFPRKNWFTKKTSSWKTSCQTPFKKLKNTLFHFVLGRVNYFAAGLTSITVEVPRYILWRRAVKEIQSRWRHKWLVFSGEAYALDWLFICFNLWGPRGVVSPSIPGFISPLGREE